MEKSRIPHRLRLAELSRMSERTHSTPRSPRITLAEQVLKSQTEPDGLLRLDAGRYKESLLGHCLTRLFVIVIHSAVCF